MTYGMALAVAMLAAMKRHKRHPPPPRELTEREKWNAEVDKRKAAKRALKGGE